MIQKCSYVKKPDGKDDNPFRYCGEYYDKETEEIYLRARYYQPAVGRFLTRDTYTGEEDEPLSLHLYTYCGNDGVNAWDPSGHKLQIKGGKRARSIIMKRLQKLTENRLEIKGLGMVRIRINKKYRGKRFKSGSLLLHGIIASNKKCKIRTFYRYSNGDVFEHQCVGVGDFATDAVITFNPRYSSSYLIYNERTGKGEYHHKPNFISLGHELIHAYKIMTGKSAQNNKVYDYIDENGKKQNSSAPAEELQTVGIIKGSIALTENSLLKEHNLPERIKY